MKKRSGEVTLIVVAAVALLGGLFLAKPRILDGDSRRADAARETAAAVVETMTAEGAAAAASVAQIGVAAASLDPAAPAVAYINREVPVVMTRLPAPDAAALLAAERRRIAIMEGRLQEADRLYAQASRESQELRRERDAALDRQAAAIRDLETVAAARLSAARQRNWFIAVCVVLVVLYLVARFYGVTPGTLGHIMRDIRAGDPPEVAFDRHIDHRLHRLVRKSTIDPE